MNRKYWLVSVLSAFILMLAACGSEEETQQEDNEITVVAQTTPMTDVVEIVAENIEEPYTVKLVEVADNIQYNEAVFNDEADASFAQHEPFMEQFNEESDADLVAMEEIYKQLSVSIHRYMIQLMSWKTERKLQFQAIRQTKRVH